MRSLLVLLALASAACDKTEPKRELDLDLIKISSDARLRTDTVGDGEFAQPATFVLVDAENTASEGAYVTLGGELVNPDGSVAGQLDLMSLWIPAKESRTFALVDSERKPRSDAMKVRIKVRGANASQPPPMVRVEQLHTFDDHGQLVVQAYIVNEAPRDGQIMVVGAFHDEQNRPIKRPFYVVKIARKSLNETGDCPDIASDLIPVANRCAIQFVGPKGAKRGTIFIADTIY